MQTILWYGIPILVGFVLGYFLALPILIVITVLVVLFAGYSLYSTKDAEIGALVGIIIAAVCTVGCVAMWATHFLITGLPFAVDLHGWFLR